MLDATVATIQKTLNFLNESLVQRIPPGTLTSHVEYGYTACCWHTDIPRGVWVHSTPPGTLTSHVECGYTAHRLAQWHPMWSAGTQHAAWHADIPCGVSALEARLLFQVSASCKIPPCYCASGPHGWVPTTFVGGVQLQSSPDLLQTDREWTHGWEISLSPKTNKFLKEYSLEL